jgi:hypothetical protein
MPLCNDDRGNAAEQLLKCEKSLIELAVRGKEEV